MASVNPSFGDKGATCKIELPETINYVDMQFLKYKCNVASPILKNNWEILLPKCKDFLTLVDRQKVAFDVRVKDLNTILISGFFKEEEAREIKKYRYQMKNNLAARKMRDNQRKVEDDIEEDINNLSEEKDELLKEKQELLKEILFYQNASQNTDNMQ